MNKHDLMGLIAIIIILFFIGMTAGCSTRGWHIRLALEKCANEGDTDEIDTFNKIIWCNTGRSFALVRP